MIHHLDVAVDIIHVAVMDETCGAYDDEGVANHDCNDDTDEDEK